MIEGFFYRNKKFSKVLENRDADQLKERLNILHCDLVQYEQGVLAKLISHDKNVQILTSSENPQIDANGFNYSEGRVLKSTIESPSILFEDQASFCSLVISVDTLGNALLLHQPLIRLGRDEELGDYQEQEIDSLTEFKMALSELSEQRENFVSGTNVSNYLRARALYKIQEYIGGDATFNSLFTEQKLDRQHSKYQGIMGILRKIFQPDFTSMTKESINGVVVIPASLSQDGRTKILLVVGVSGMQVRSELAQFGIEQP